MGVLGCHGFRRDSGVEIPDDLLTAFWLMMEFAFDGREGAQEKAAGIGHDSATARSDFVAGEKFVKFAERAVDGDGGSELDGVTDEACGDVGGVAIFLLLGGVAEAKARRRVGDEVAAAAFGRAMLTAGKFRDVAGFSCFWT